MNAKSLINTSLAFGLLTGGIVFAFFLVLYFVGLPPLGGKKEVSVGFNLIMMGVAVWYYRKFEGQGYLHLWQALSICYLTNLVGALVSASLITLFVKFIDPQVLTNYILDSLKIIDLSKKDILEEMGEGTLRELITNIKKTQASTIFADEVIKKLLIGAIPALLISLYFRRQAPQS